MAYGDTITYEWGEGERKCSLRLTYNMSTFLIYKRFFDSDLMNDVIKLAQGSDVPADMLSKITNGELTVADIDKVDLSKLSNATIDMTILSQIVIAMVATNERVANKRRSVEEIANDIPASIISDPDFFNCFYDLILFGLKKTVKA